MMENLQKDADLSSDEGVLNFYKSVLKYRDLHKDRSEEIARFTFDSTFEVSSRLAIDEKVKKIRYEFGALEAPGSLDNVPDGEYVDMLWARLAGLVDDAKDEKRTV
jgi:hypothetical protein